MTHPTPDEIAALADRLKLHAYELTNGGANATQLQADLRVAAESLTMMPETNQEPEWGRWLAWLVNGAQERDEGIAAAKWIVEWRQAQATRLAQVEQALQSIANNSCCAPCQEAAMVARAALAVEAAPKDP